MRNKIQEKKYCYLRKYNIKHVDWRDTHLLEKFMNPHGRILSRKRTGCSAKQQRQIEQAIKRSRFMAFVPYVK